MNVVIDWQHKNCAIYITKKNMMSILIILFEELLEENRNKLAHSYKTVCFNLLTCRQSRNVQSSIFKKKEQNDDIH